MMWVAPVVALVLRILMVHFVVLVFAEYQASSSVWVVQFALVVPSVWLLLVEEVPCFEMVEIAGGPSLVVVAVGTGVGQKCVACFAASAVVVVSVVVVVHVSGVVACYLGPTHLGYTGLDMYLG